jgi:hypothetical protein
MKIGEMTAASRHASLHTGRIAEAGPIQPVKISRTFFKPGDTPSASPGAGCRLLPSASASSVTFRFEVWT